MLRTQIETVKFGTPNSVGDVARAHAARRNHRSGFTLTELLVVIAIIAVLSALLIGAVGGVRIRAKQAAITLELQNMGGAIEDLNNEFGAYPPNGMNNRQGGSGVDLAETDFVRMFKKAFPRNKEPDDLILALSSTIDANLTGPYDVTLPQNDGGSSSAGGGLTAAEAVFFWLGGFSSDTSYPISGPGGPSFEVDTTVSGLGEVLEDRNFRYEFDLSRLEPRTADGVFDQSAGNGRYITYSDPRISPAGDGPLRRINLWTYRPDGSNQPVMYFDTSRHTPEEYDIDMTGRTGLSIYALKQLREGISQASRNADVRWVEDKKFQLLHCGVDDIWGDSFQNFRLDVASEGVNAYQSQNLILAPDGPFLGDVADTLGSFMPGTLEDKQE
ncbi:MAG: prepilin-type N-terminal cleavage/methylation domain-containing protein [Planctomycetota bacterium]